jgi:hypothetical protein
MLLQDGEVHKSIWSSCLLVCSEYLLNFKKEFRKMRMIFASGLLVAAALSSVAESADIRSGLVIGSYPKAYNVTDVTGPASGNGLLCYRCRYGSQPVVNIFAHKMDENVVKLIKQIDDVVGKNRDNKMAAFVVLLSDKPEAEEGTLKEIAKLNELQHTPLTTYGDSEGPGSYRLSKDAEVTVMMWVDEEVKVNHALKFADLSPEKIQAISDDTAKILN